MCLLSTFKEDKQVSMSGFSESKEAIVPILMQYDEHTSCMTYNVQ
jgi:hypothetical protein